MENLSTEAVTAALRERDISILPPEAAAPEIPERKDPVGFRVTLGELRRYAARRNRAMQATRQMGRLGLSKFE